MQNVSCRVCGEKVVNQESVNYHDKCMQKLRNGKAITLGRKAYVTK